MARIAIGDDEKKKLTILGGLLAAIAVVVVVLYVVPNMGGGAKSEDAPAPASAGSTTTPADIPSAAGGAPATDGAAPAGGSGGAAPGGITAASLVSVESYRPDPFAPFILPPLPTPTPAPPPPPPVVIPPPVEIVPPDQIGGGGGFSLPPMGVNRSGSRPLAALPPIVPRRVATAPTAPRFFAPSGGQGSGAGILRSQNKRLSGVIIGDSVRALLEISNGETVTTRVVQPGDEVDGIRILRLERVNEAGRTITRLVVRENNQEQYVELRAAPQQATGEGGLGIGGPPGAFPGGPPGAMPF